MRGVGQYISLSAGTFSFFFFLGGGGEGRVKGEESLVHKYMYMPCLGFLICAIRINLKNPLASENTLICPTYVK